jgi:hypothetical protein
MGEVVIINDGPNETVIVSDVGVQGASSGEKPPYVHRQDMPAAIWHVTHALGFRPSSIRVQDLSEDEIDGFDITNEDDNSFDLVFSGPFSGVARIK